MKMKEAPGKGNGSDTNSSTAAVDREKTKMRERERRSITTKIFHGLRKHGGYRLSPRADINQVLRELAKEAGWTVEPDGTTYRSSSTTITTTPINVSNFCQACGTGIIKSGTPTPTSGFIGEGECSATASPGGPAINPVDPLTSQYYSRISSASGGPVVAPELPENIRNNSQQLAMYMMYGRLPSGGSNYLPGGGIISPSSSVYGQQQQIFTSSQVASNENTPVGSPQHRS